MHSTGTSDDARRAFLLRIIGDIVSAGISLGLMYLGTRAVRSAMDPSAGRKAADAAAAAALRDRLAAAGVSPAALRGMSACEVALTSELVFPEDIETGWADVGGLDGIKQELVEEVVYPLVRPDLFVPPSLRGADAAAGGGDALRALGRVSSLLSAPKGVLFYGPPGTGKTMLAKALAKESGALFLSVSPSSLLSKWVGETNQLTRGLFSLAARVAPAIIFLDEVDALFRARSSAAGGEHEVSREMKAEFMSLWDGLTTNSTGGVVVIGATNRPADIDEAILRRMPKAFEIPLPNGDGRVAILRRLLADIPVAVDFDVDAVAAVTVGYSGSDLKELCRTAARVPMREVMASVRAAQVAAGGVGAVRRGGRGGDQTPRAPHWRSAPPRGCAR
ncbi:hypothetical protein BU14_0109s0001 [Porphyra umbilicalis]|uniref:AAA+ ATPase domain-containing protein n=1 Tax=Porphyra umbilicalis TaxID=2786 RepID=A0A1X6PC06_PORUM|nr:hypothetical protein BU14_0109s0001 [Porphyra umbilicalis]|eukprot:OSX78402.1 hypothetical protein BU14_0109s0001 [Porphyra umbilicalis]